MSDRISGDLIEDSSVPFVDSIDLNLRCSFCFNTGR